MTDNLRYQPDAAALREFKLRRRLAAASTLPGILSFANLLEKTAMRIKNFHNLKAGLPGDIAKLEAREDGNLAGNDFGSGFGYIDEAREVEVASYYRAQIEQGDLDNQVTESGAVYRATIGKVSAVLRTRPDIGCVTNFGVSFGYTDAELAKAFPAVRFYGVDRSRLTKAYNDNIFSLPNLTFEAGDIFNHMAAQRGQPWLLLHVRTATLLPHAFVDKLYGAAASCGCAGIVALEQCGISWQTGEPYRFDAAGHAKASVVFRNGMFIHNYPGLMEKHGFKVTDSELLKTNHPDATYRIACVTGLLPR